MNRFDYDLNMLENRLMDCRRNLNDIMLGNIESGNSPDINVRNMYWAKISQLQSEINYLNNQLNFLRNHFNNVNSLNNVNVATQQHFSQPNSASNIAFNGQQVGGSFAGQNVNQQPGHVNQQFGPVKPQAEFVGKTDSVSGNKDNVKNDFEWVLGKFVMAIFASVLIFISFFLFANIFIPILGNQFKFGIMLFVSLVFIVVGMLKLKNNKEAVFLSICGCGVGGLYITILLGNILFGLYNEIVLYLLIFVWAVFVCILSKIKNKVYLIIGHCGITLSVIFGCVLCLKNHDTDKFLVLTLFYLITMILFFAFNCKHSYGKNQLNHVFSSVDIFFLVVFYLLINIAHNDVVFAGIVISLAAAFQIALAFVLKIDEDITGYGVYVMIHTLYLIAALSVLVNNIFVVSFYIIAISFVLLVLLEVKGRKQSVSRVILQIFAAVIMVIGFLLAEELSSTVNLLIVIIAFTVLGVFTNDFVYKYISLSVIMLFSFSTESISPFIVFGVGLIYFGILLSTQIFVKKQYNIVFKNIGYCMALLFVLMVMPDVLKILIKNSAIERLVVFFVLAVGNMVAMKSNFTKNILTGEKSFSTAVITYVINVFNMVTVLYFIGHENDLVLHYIYVFLGIVLFLANSKNLLYDVKNIFGGLYFGFKLTVFIVETIISFEAANSVVSIVLFVFAMVCVIGGFLIKIKSIRLYGLILSIISVIKLMLIDSHYKNTIDHALSFFVCGVICFAISFIYSYIEKKISKGQKNG